MHAVSDGQRRRVQLLLGLMRPREVLLLDEITTDLDLIARQDLLAFLRRGDRARGTTILYATHIFDTLDRWATDIVYLVGRQGRGRRAARRRCRSLPIDRWSRSSSAGCGATRARSAVAPAWRAAVVDAGGGIAASTSCGCRRWSVPCGSRSSAAGRRAAEMFVADVPRAARGQLLDDVAALLDGDDDVHPGARGRAGVRLLGKHAIAWIAVHRRGPDAEPPVDASSEPSEVLTLYDRQHDVEVELVAGDQARSARCSTARRPIGRA